ncbi:phage antirepressor KilAC domain-containing protein [Pseudomonas gingeri]|uniref:phage antirepressor KilAC domain-containing protein n=1 Tax=Pseudomonas gingeri TaxID=117681 RepID=UPI0015A44A99|nr:phage antirepressor KilAC domain-containing protein [Pseudomonas gingeri]NWA25488.1 phage antirepressor KilAC domain-containing protein [Pseudomonas gingeri]
MSSREIADLVEARHNDVVSTIERLFRKGLLRSTRKTRRESTGGRPTEVYDLIERDTHLVVAGYSDEHRARVIDRWQELESKVVGQLQIPVSFAEALRLAADQAEQNLHLQHVIQQQAPKVQALERLAGTHGSICITSAAKQLGLGPLKLFKWMSDNRWIYRRSGFAAWSAYQPRLSSGLLEHKLIRVGKGTEEELKVVEQVMVTRRGIVALAEQIQGNPL